MEFRKTGWTTRLKRFALAVDSWVDAGLWGAARRGGEVYERIRSATDRLTVSGGQGEFEGIGDGVDSRGALLVRLPDGERHKVDSADVSVRRA